MKRKSLAVRANEYAHRTAPYPGINIYCWAWAQRAWLAGYRAGQKDAKKAAEEASK